MKSKPSKITKLDQKDSYGNSTFVIEFADGSKGFFTTKDENQTKFVVGTEVEYVLTETQGKNGKYNKITLPQPAQPQKSFGGGKPQQDPRIQMIGFSASYTKDLIVGGKVDMKEFETTFDRIYKAMISKI